MTRGLTPPLAKKPGLIGFLLTERSIRLYHPAISFPSLLSMWTFLTSRPVCSLLAAAFLLRAGMAFVVQGLLDHHWHRQFVIEGDADGYWRLGQQLASGKPYAIYEPPRYVLRMPGFPLLLSLPLRLFPDNFLAARLFLAMVGTGTCGLVYLLGRELIDHRTGLVAGWFTAISPAMVGFSVLILSETAFALGVVGSLWAMARLLRHLSPETSVRRVTGWAIATGLFIALATYMRPNWLPVALVCAVGALLCRRFHRKAVLASVLVLASTYLALLPWAARNEQVTGHWVFTTLWSGPSLYDGLHPKATGESDMTFFDRDNLLATMSEYEVNQHYWDAGMEYARTHPQRAIELGFVKLWRFWKPWPSAREAGGWASKLVLAVFSLVLFAGAAFGGWLHRRNLVLLALTIGPVLFFSGLHAIFVGSLRYRLPAEYPMAVLAAAGWLEMYRRSKIRRSPDGQADSATPSSGEAAL